MVTLVTGCSVVAPVVKLSITLPPGPRLSIFIIQFVPLCSIQLETRCCPSGLWAELASEVSDFEWTKGANS